MATESNPIKKLMLEKKNDLLLDLKKDIDNQDLILLISSSINSEEAVWLRYLLNIMHDNYYKNCIFKFYFFFFLYLIIIFCFKKKKNIKVIKY